MGIDSVSTATRSDPANAPEVSKKREPLPTPPGGEESASSPKIGERSGKIGDRTSASVSSEKAPEAEADADAAPDGSSASGRTRRPRDQGGSGLQIRAEEFRALAADLREQAKAVTGYRADNLNARADRADAAADRMDAAAKRSGGEETTSAPETGGKSTEPDGKAAEAKDTKPAKSKPAVEKSDPVSSAGKPAPATGNTFRATEMTASGYWTQAMVGGRPVMVWNPESPTGAQQSNYDAPDPNQMLSFEYSPAKSGQHQITVEGARIDSAVNSGEYQKHKGSAKGVHHLGNDVYLQVRDMDTGELVMRSQKFLLRINDNGDTVISSGGVDAHGKIIPATVDLEAGGNYRVEFLGRSDGFAVAGASVAPT